MKKIIFTLVMLFSLDSMAADIALGNIRGLKVYDFDNNKSIRIYFEKNAIHTNSNACVEQGYQTAIITVAKHDEATVDRMLSIVLAAQMANKKIRVASANANSCEVDFIALQESYF
ncbi:hypothetical protein [Pseudoalteromonas luteoviolacea]|uniref:DUF3718 domain-containing protein n=1 Tax=Pseudoalteromonas luteoviolacea S4060-1 TaxID=1365257 RepID=A0A161YFG3_9GAMM|nr:hypothetical protein [Pseudoalteromonas luteoviolacea]KZN59026.1 hypothetical protein N478_09350 [Pseudoalteromonas luteoviolacea S4060-1]